MILHVEMGDTRLQFVPEDSPVEVGRGVGCAVRLAHPLVSRSHGAFRWADGGWRYDDTSRHGTQVVGSDGDVRFLNDGGRALPWVFELRVAGEDGARLRCRLEPSAEATELRRLYAEGLEAQAQGRWAAALSAFLPLARRDPPAVEALFRSAECLEQSGRSAEALPWAVRYGFLRPDEVRAWLLLARLHGAVGDLASARAALARVGALDAGAPEVAELRERLQGVEVGAEALGSVTADVYGSPVPHVLVTPRFRIECDFAAHGRLLPDLAKALEVAAARVSEVLGEPPGPISVTVVGRDARPDEVPGLGDQMASAACDAKGIRLFLPPGRARACHDAPYLAVLALHEVVHAVLWNEGGNLPWWLHEGMAQFLSQGSNAVGVPPAPPAAVALERFERQPDPAETRVGYALAHFAVIHLHGALESRGLAKLIRRLADGATAAEAFEAFGESVERVSEGAWARWVRIAPSEASYLKTRDHVPSRLS